MEKFITKHTPGPWQLGDENNSSCEVMIGNTTCSVDRADKNTWEYNISREEMIANAHLICASPFLLSALIELVQALESWPEAARTKEDEESLTLAKAAIAAAGVVVEESKPENKES